MMYLTGSRWHSYGCIMARLILPSHLSIRTRIRWGENQINTSTLSMAASHPEWINTYTFNCLFDAHKPGSFIDQDFTTVDDYKVNGIPAKFVIDRNGNIRFKVDGFSGNEQALIDEMDNMIALAAEGK